MSNKVQPRSADIAFGATVNAVLFQQRASRKDLSKVLGVTGTMATRKLRGDVGWSLSDILKTAAWLRVPVENLLPKPTDDTADTFAPAMLDASLVSREEDKDQ